MIAFGVSLRDGHVPPRLADGLHRATEPDSPVLQSTGLQSLFAANAEIIEAAAAMAGLEALVLVHDDAELLAEDVCDRLRSILADESVAVVGAAGGRHIESLRWWEGEEIAGRLVDGGVAFDEGKLPADVHLLDGCLLALSPWAVQTLRPEPSAYPAFVGYEAELCSLARLHGRRVVAADLGVAHHRQPHGERAELVLADHVWRARWASLPE